MKLGMSQACYRWTIYPDLRWDQPQYGYRGMPLPYGTSVTPPQEIDGWIDWLLDKCVSLGLSPLHATTAEMRDEADAREFGGKVADRGLEYIGSGGGRFAGTAEEWEQDSGKFIHQIKLAKAAGANIVAAVSQHPPGGAGQPLLNGGNFYGHFSKRCSIEEQIDRMVRNFGELMPICEELGMVLAFENHMDYRISEIVQVVEGVNSPCLRINYDTANSWSVIEDAVEAAHLAAPYTVMTHVKDMRAQSTTTIGEPAFFHAPIGYGNVEIREILDILQRNAPAPENLPQCLEVPPPPPYDPDHWMRLSIDWLKEHAAEYFCFD